MIAKRKPFPALPAGICLVGLFFCLWVLFSGGEELCLTNGCTLFQETEIAGISLWHAGSALFVFLLLFCLARFVFMARLLALAALFIDTFLLGVMLFTAPCVNCLIVGILIALACLSLCRVEKNSARPALFWLWLLFFLFNAGSVVRDFSEPWHLLAGEEQAVHVYFSPSCQACRKLTAQAEKLSEARWYPVSENRRDLWVIHAMQERVESGVPLSRAVAEALAAVPEGAAFEASREYRYGLLRPKMLLLQFRLWKNRAHVLASGSERLPFVEFAGLPSAFLPPARQEQEKTREQIPVEKEESTSIPGLDMGVAGFCGGEEPCTEPEPAAPQGSLHDLLEEGGFYRP